MLFSSPLFDHFYATADILWWSTLAISCLFLLACHLLPRNRAHSIDAMDLSVAAEPGPRLSKCHLRGLPHKCSQSRQSPDSWARSGRMVHTHREHSLELESCLFTGVGMAGISVSRATLCDVFDHYLDPTHHARRCAQHDSAPSATAGDYRHGFSWPVVCFAP